MNGKELIYRAFNNESLERTPWVPYTGVQVGKLRGYSAEEVLKEGDKLYECLVEANRQYSPDGQPVIFDLQVEAEVLGCDLLWAEDAPPTVKTHPLADSAEIPAKIPAKDEGRFPLILDVMKRMKETVGETTALYGLGCGPFTLASHLRSTNLFMDMYDDPDYVHNLLDYCADVFIAVADYYIEAGMDIIGAVDPLISQISPDSFEEFMMKPYKKVFDHIRSKGVFSSFFVCGDATKNLDVMSQTGPDCLSIDENINLVEAKKVTDKYNIVISGNIQLTICMLLGTQQDNQKAAIEKIGQMGDRNFILAPGCDMPYDTPPENIIGIGQAVQDVEATRKLLENYEKAELDIDVKMPDYANLERPLIEVLTIDSATCAACGYMTAAARDMKAIFGSKIDVVERKITEPENIIRVGKLGVMNLPTMVINGEVKFISIIPNREELKAAVEAVL
ncbi:MAG: thioredoxin family protein [Spirochaetales bacterium]|nr:thioredoxin family protein [Spirochaetales bacterium]